MVSLAGKTLGKYRLIEQLGRGGFASVYKAYQARLDRYVAIKVLHPHLVEGEDFLARFEREAKAVAGLRHPHIVIVHDFDVQENSYYMVMEYIDGESLKERLEDLNTRGQYLSLAEINRIMADITSALDYAHHQGMLHRDIKPSNVILNKLGDAFLTDFGIARILSSTHFTATGALIGTPAYMSPEQGQGLGVSPASDVYSLGIMLYEFLTGRVPYDADTPLAIIFKHIRDPLPSIHTTRPDLPTDLEKVVYKALAKDPEDRYQSPGDMMQALQKALIKDLQAETLLSGPVKPTILVSQTLEKVKEIETAAQESTIAVDEFKGDVRVESIQPKDASEQPAVELEGGGVPPSEVGLSSPELGEMIESLTAETIKEEKTAVGPAEAATLAVDAENKKASLEKQPAIEPAVARMAEESRSPKRGKFPTKRWVIGGIALVGIIVIGFLLFTLFQPRAGVAPTEVALAATTTLNPTRRPSPTAPLPATEVPGLAQFEEGIALLTEERNFIAAIEKFNQAEALGLESPELFANRARACYESKLIEERCSFEDAIRDYSRAIELDPRQAWYYDGRAWSYAHREQWPSAIEDISRAIELQPQNPDYWINRGEIFIEMGNWDQAITDFNHAIDLRPDYPRSYDARGTAFSTTGNLEGAVQDFTTAIELNPQNFEYWISRGRNFLRLEQFDQAIADFTQALELNDRAIPAYLSRAEAFARLEDLDATLQDLETAIRLAPEDDRVYLEKAHILWWYIEDYQAALEALDQAIEYNPKSWEAFNNRGEIYAYELHNHELALENFNQSIAVAPRGLDAPFLNRGAYFQLVNNLEAALEDLTMAIHINPTRPEGYRNRGDVYRELGDLDAARSDYQIFLELTQGKPEFEEWRVEIETWLAQHPE